MSLRENTKWLLRTFFEVASSGYTRQNRRRTFGLAALMTVTFVVFFVLFRPEAGAPASAPTLPASAVPFAVGGSALVITLVIAFVTSRRNLRRDVELLRATGPGPLLEAWDARIARMPKLEVLEATRASIHCLGHAVFGDEAAARQALASVDWRHLPPAALVDLYVAEAMLENLFTGDHARALAHARRAVPAAAMPIPVPTSRRRLALHVAVSELLAGECTPTTRSTLEATLRRHEAPLLRAYVAWALATDAVRRKDADAGRKWAGIVAELAPHARALHELPPTAPVAPAA